VILTALAFSSFSFLLLCLSPRVNKEKAKTTKAKAVKITALQGQSTGRLH
jgi:hypothetical protein